MIQLQKEIEHQKTETNQISEHLEKAKALNQPIVSDKSKMEIDN
jgi:hypothetical protein